MAKRFDPGILAPSTASLKRGQFFARWGGVCGVCGKTYDKREICHYVGDKVAHENCHGFGEGIVESDSSSFEFDGKDEREPSYVVRGKRTPPLCGSCFLEHNGECP